MDQELRDLFQSVEIIEPLSLSEEIMVFSKGTISCDKGYVCGIGEVQVGN